MYGIPHSGDLVKWISDWHVYSADSLGEVHGEVPVYSFGVVLEAYNDRKILVVFSHDIGTRYLINLELVDCEVVSKSKARNIDNETN